MRAALRRGDVSLATVMREQPAGPAASHGAPTGPRRRPRRDVDSSPLVLRPRRTRASCQGPAPASAGGQRPDRTPGCVAGRSRNDRVPASAAWPPRRSLPHRRSARPQRPPAPTPAAAPIPLFRARRFRPLDSSLREAGTLGAARRALLISCSHHPRQQQERQFWLGSRRGGGAEELPQGPDHRALR